MTQLQMKGKNEEFYIFKRSGFMLLLKTCGGDRIYPVSPHTTALTKNKFNPTLCIYRKSILKIFFMLLLIFIVYESGLEKNVPHK
jgi:hypothetical protein